MDSCTVLTSCDIVVPRYTTMHSQDDRRMASGAPYSKAHRAARCPAIRKSGPGFAWAACDLLRGEDLVREGDLALRVEGQLEHVTPVQERAVPATGDLVHRGELRAGDPGAGQVVGQWLVVDRRRDPDLRVGGELERLVRPDRGGLDRLGTGGLGADRRSEQHFCGPGPGLEEPEDLRLVGVRREPPGRGHLRGTVGD